MDPRFSSGSVCFYVGMASKQRLDLQLLTRAWRRSRQQAQQLIRAGKVRDGAGQLLDKPGLEVAMIVCWWRSLRVSCQGGRKAAGRFRDLPD